MRPYIATTLATIAGSAIFALCTAPGARAQEVAKPVSVCKSLDQPTCSAKPSCGWVAERKAGETMSKAGKLHKANAKAHCRTKPATSKG
jgi:hypothetical protein